MSAQLSQIPYSYDHSLDVPEVFPEAKTRCRSPAGGPSEDQFLALALGEIQTAEMLEIQLVNSVAPFVLCNRLADLMKQDHYRTKTYCECFRHGRQIPAV